MLIYQKFTVHPTHKGLTAYEHSSSHSQKLKGTCKVPSSAASTMSWWHEVCGLRNQARREGSEQLPGRGHGRGGVGHTRMAACTKRFVSRFSAEECWRYDVMLCSKGGAISVAHPVLLLGTPATGMQPTGDSAWWNAALGLNMLPTLAV